MDMAGEGTDAIETDERLRWAFERTLYLVGEAARSLSETTQASIDQPWKRIVGLRTILAHRYQAIDVSTLVEIARLHLPGLMTAIRIHLK